MYLFTSQDFLHFVSQGDRKTSQKGILQIISFNATSWKIKQRQEKIERAKTCSVCVKLEVVALTALKKY